MKHDIYAQKTVQKKLTMPLIPLFSLLLGILCFSCLFFSLFSGKPSCLFNSVLAKSTKITTEHFQVSDACDLSEKVKYIDELPAYETGFYRILSSKPFQITISSKQLKSLVVSWLDEQGNSVALKKIATSNGISLYPKHTVSGNCFFIEINNNSTTAVSVTLFYNFRIEKDGLPAQKTTAPALQKSKTPPSPTPKRSLQKKPSLSRKKTAKPKQSNKKTVRKQREKTYPPQKKNLSEVSRQNTVSSNQQTVPETPSGEKKKEQTDSDKISLLLKPHFVKLKTGKKKTLSFSLISQNKSPVRKYSANEFLWLSTNPDIITVKKGVITAKKAGIAIVFLRHKKNDLLHSSSLVRIY